MEIEWDPIVLRVAIAVTVIILISIWRFGEGLGWDAIPLSTRILISVLTPPVAFFVGQMVINK